MKYLNMFALIATALWISGVIYFARLDWTLMLKMKPNEWGDFLAGTVSPLAFFWLVVGYLQQGVALRLNTDEIKLQREALLLQHQELAEQVKATLQVAGHAEQQAQASSLMADLTLQEQKKREFNNLQSSLPVFRFTIISLTDESEAARVLNEGGSAIDVQFRNSNSEMLQLDCHNLLNGESGILRLDGVNLANDVLYVSYRGYYSTRGQSSAYEFVIKDRVISRKTI
jgi:hypothetical protein